MFKTQMFTKLSQKLVSDFVKEDYYLLDTAGDQVIMHPNLSPFKSLPHGMCWQGQGSRMTSVDTF